MFLIDQVFLQVSRLYTARLSYLPEDQVPYWALNHSVDDIGSNPKAPGIICIAERLYI